VFDASNALHHALWIQVFPQNAEHNAENVRFV
jgi:hypothetical protein